MTSRPPSGTTPSGVPPAGLSSVTVRRLERVADALKVVALIETVVGDTPTAAAQALAALERLAEIQTSGAPPAIGNRASPASLLVGLSRVAARLAPTIDAVWLPALAEQLRHSLMASEMPDDHGVGAESRGPADRMPGAVDLVTAIRVLIYHGGPLETRTGGRAALSTAAGYIRAAAERSGDAMTAALARNDAPDLTALSLECLRFEGLHFLAECLGDRRTADDLARVSRRVARVGLTQATQTINGYLETRDMLDMFDSAVVLGRIDDAMTLSQRLLEALNAGEEERTPSVVPADQVAFDAFITALDRLAGLTLAMLGRVMASPSGKEVVVRSLLGQLGNIGRFCLLLPVSGNDGPGGSGRTRLADLRERLLVDVARFVDTLLVRLDQHTAASGGDGAGDGSSAFLITCVEAAAAALVRMGYDEAAARFEAGVRAIASRSAGPGGD